MITIRCSKCGETINVDEKSEAPICSKCGAVIDLERDAPQKLQERKERKEAFENKLNDILSRYREKGDAKELNVTIQNREQYRGIPDLDEVWKNFILKAAGISLERKDEEVQSYLKSQAILFDSKNQREQDGLYVALLQAYPKLGSDTDWEKLIAQTHGDEALFRAISDSLISYIVKARDKAFAMDIFGRLSAKKGEWANAGRIYLIDLLKNKEVASQVFPVSAFNARTKRFAREVSAYCNRYLEKGNRITLEETDVWKNYLEACRIQKRRRVIIASCCCAVLLAAVLGGAFFLNAVNKETVKIDVAKVITVNYGETLDLSDYSVTYRKNSGVEMKEPLTMKMLSGYDPELVGSPQTVYVEFAGVRNGITVLVNPAELPAPVLTQDGNFVTWEFVAHAKDYNVYVNSASVVAGTTAALSYDLSYNANYGALSVTVRANAESEKYSNSAMSGAITVTKLQPPSNLRYEGGFLRWDEVEGVEKYELHINGTPAETDVNYYKTDFKQGDNEVRIIARASSSSVIAGVVSQTISYHHIPSISSMTYQNDTVSWEAGEDATTFSVYVDGEYWTDLYRNYFRIKEDGFLEKFGEREHTIGVVCKSSAPNTEPSETVSYRVAIGNHASVGDGALNWEPVGAGATYHVQINGGQPYKLSRPSLPLSDVQWQEGENVVSVRAYAENEEIVCETVTFNKLKKPELYVSDGGWTTDGNVNNRYSVNGGAWDPDLPDAEKLEAGDYTVRAKKIASGENPFEIESDTVELKVRKPAAPTISVRDGALAVTYDKTLYTIRLFCAKQEGAFTEISSLSEIREAGVYLLKARLTAAAGVTQGFDLVLDSGESAQIEVTKPEAPNVFYEDGALAVTSDVPEAKFYYLDGEEERELPGGLVSNLPKGIFTVYARRPAQKAGELDSENTPENKRVSVYNMNITLSITKFSSTQLTAVFGDCEEVDELKFTFEIRYYDRTGAYIGNKTGEVSSLKKSSASSSNMVTRINYGLEVDFEPGYELKDVYRLEFIVKFSSESGGQTLKAEMLV